MKDGECVFKPPRPFSRKMFKQGIFGTLTWSLIIVQISHRFLSQNYIGTFIAKLSPRYVPVFLHNIHSAEPVLCNGRAFDAEARRPGFEPRPGQLHFPFGKEFNPQY